jgi:hypothetical protein
MAAKPTGMNHQIVRDVDDAVAVIRRRLGPSVHSVYLLGSHVDTTAVELSDVDLFMLLNDSSAQTLLRSRSVDDEVRQEHPSVDSIIRTTGVGLREPGWRRWAPAVELGSALIEGEDARPSIAMPTMMEYTVDSVEAFRSMIARVQRRRLVTIDPAPLSMNTDLGQFVTKAPVWTRVEYWTHDLCVIVSQAASVLVSINACGIPHSRASAHALFAACGPEQWRAVVADIDRDCRRRWGYRVPTDSTDLRVLSRYCQAASVLETDCLAAVDEWLATRTGISG